MNRTLRISSLAALVFASLAAGASELAVEITDLRSTDGALMVAVVDSAAGWDDNSKAVARQKLAPSGERMTLRFPDLAPGSYAVLVMHDENGNGKLDANFLGMPVEGYGFSNNPKVMRKPNYDEARFDLGAANATITVQLR